ncbi:MAG: histidine--tRNA ligase [Lactovum sp.]
MKLQKPKGTADLSPKESYKWQFIEKTVKEVFSLYNFKETRTPIFEYYEVIKRSVGESTDIVQKEMYDFYDKAERHITLRPEGTAPIVRSFVENKFYAPEIVKPFKTFYIGPMFRYERPQSGRLRQFHQIGAEILGLRSPEVDAELISMMAKFLKELGLSQFSLRLNSLGTSESRQDYRQSLISYFKPYFSDLSTDSQRRLEENPLRVLDSKDKKDKEIAKNAPSILDSLSPESQEYFDSLKLALDKLELSYVIDDRIVRGLDYYTDTIFEFVTTVDGQELTLCGGGRYDSLVEYFEGPATPAIGFAIGIERLILALELEAVEIPDENKLDLFIAVLGKENNSDVLKLAESIRIQGFHVEQEYLGRKLAAQYKTAEKLKARTLLIVGADEIQTGKLVLKNTITKKELSTSLEELSTNFASIYRNLMMEEKSV